MATRASLVTSSLNLFAGTSIGARTATLQIDAPRAEHDANLHRLTGTWFVIATIRTGREKQASQPVVHYSLDDNGASKPWRAVLQRIFKPPQRVLFINDDFSRAVVSRGKKSVWILSRTPRMSCEDFFRCAQQVREQGYDTRRLTFMPQTS
mgnify:CR=1 FL=1